MTMDFLSCPNNIKSPQTTLVTPSYGIPVTVSSNRRRGLFKTRNTHLVGNIQVAEALNEVTAIYYWEALDAVVVTDPLFLLSLFPLSRALNRKRVLDKAPTSVDRKLSYGV